MENKIIEKDENKNEEIEKIEGKEAKETKKVEESKEEIEKMLLRLRVSKGWTRLQLVEKLEDNRITEKTIKKWEYGLEYPDLNTIYKLSEIYRVPSNDFVTAKSNSYEKGLAGINKNVIRFISYALNVSFYVGTVITILIYVIALIGAFLFFLYAAYSI